MLPPELNTGVYANLAAVWHTPFDFVLDFAVLDQPREDPDNPNRGIVAAPVVARVRVPTGVIFQIAKAIAENVDQYERQYGAITARPPEISPPEDQTS